MVNSYSDSIRCSIEFKTLLRAAQLEFIKKGKKPPSDTQLTKIIANKIKKEDILYNEFIPF